MTLFCDKLKKWEKQCVCITFNISDVFIYRYFVVKLEK
jgi:hypothetical protein